MRVLIVGGDELAGVVSGALSEGEFHVTDQALSGLWTAGHESFDAAIIDVGLADSTDRLVRNLRTIAPQTRVVLVCDPRQEPEAIAALTLGVDDYLLAPVSLSDLQLALHLPTVTRVVVPEEVGPSPEEVVELGDVLRRLDDGPRETLRRLCALVRTGVQARSVAVTLDDITTSVGSDDPPVLLEPIRRNEEVVGGLAVGPAVTGAYHTSTSRRLKEYAALIETIVGQSRERAHWRDLAWTDDLSRLRNRRFFDQKLDQLLVRCASERLQLTLFLFDIDDFKTYNDRFGHDTGDELIREVATLLSKCTREGDVVARYGGDEFAVVFWESERPRVPGSRHPTDVTGIAERLCATIAAHRFQCLGAGAPGPVTISGGLASFPWSGRTRLELMRAADVALMEAKQRGKNRILLSDGGAVGDGEREL